MLITFFYFYTYRGRMEVNMHQTNLSPDLQPAYIQMLITFLTCIHSAKLKLSIHSPEVNMPKYNNLKKVNVVLKSAEMILHDMNAFAIFPVLI